jgi:hypothetical protein
VHHGNDAVAAGAGLVEDADGGIVGHGDGCHFSKFFGVLETKVFLVPPLLNGARAAPQA